ncbi:hypothetical protein BCR33DRAFT_713925 [Rhizoclosmatium globosum]|uniref:EamA domain-containing protein n=1 Tax=Rhizoclosmatium globosum TaxID=329046 RepID=A0A1Y2CRR3_9FUNG|nr:hypothetical protein BCR33DRAFT_713925 [Rhizoclosmatium globosum]|eukprot:ORY49606.1 hypothetical protein BCR33DRAFT_713925 [Rhizoclosmatium globosum]
MQVMTAGVLLAVGPAFVLGQLTSVESVLRGRAIADVGVASASAPVSCVSDTDCAAQTALQGVSGQSAYLCVSGVCSRTVAAGRVCQKASDCAQYQWVVRKLARNATSLSYILGPSPTVAANITVDEYLHSLCAPEFCTIASSCGADSTALFNPANPLRLPTYDNEIACCSGGADLGTCSVFGTSGPNAISVSTCSGTTSCTPGSTAELFCTPANQGSTLWIGIVICLVGAACNNIGLNLQKLALRKRAEKLEEENAAKNKEEQEMKLKISALKFPNSFSSSVKRNLNTLKRPFNRKYANVQDDQMDPEALADAAAAAAVAAANGNNEAIMALNAELDHQQKSLINARRRSLGHELNNVAVGDNVLVNSTSTTTAYVTRPDGTLEEALPISVVVAPSSDKRDLQQSLGFGNLVKNPIWVLGLIVYISANFLNFAALQFAPQSLVAPLSGVSLVVNVIAAPLINKEKFTWKDVVGGVFIVGGSSMTVVFAGVSSSDYNLCVLLKLFQRVPTIIFLITTMACMIGTFSYICIVEKNVESSSDVANSGAPKNPPFGAEITITTTTTTTTTHIPQHTESTVPSNLVPPSPLLPPLPPNAPGGANNPAILDWTSSLYSKIYIPSPIKQRVSRLWGSRSGTPSIVPLSGAESPHLGSLAVPSPLGQGHVPMTSDTGLGIDVGHSRHGRLQVPLSGDDEVEYDRHEPSYEEFEDVPMDKEVVVVRMEKRRESIELLRVVNEDGVPQFKISDAHEVSSQGKVVKGLNSSSVTLLGATGVDASAVSVTAIKDDEEEEEEKEEYDENGKIKKKSLWKRLYKILPKPLKRNVDKISAIQLIPRFEKKISLNSKIVSIGLPLCYAALGGLMGTTCTLFAKSTIHLLTNSFLGDNQFNSLYSWLIAAVTVFTALAQVYWINMGLQRYDALLQIPVFFVVWTVFDVVGGGVYFNEFEGFTARQYGLFILAIGVIFLGVFVLGDRLKRSHV